MAAAFYVTNPVGSGGDGAAISNGNYHITIDYKAQYEWKGFKIAWLNNGGMIKTFKVLQSNDGINFSVMNLTGSSNQAITTNVPNFANNITGTYDATGLLTNNGGSGSVNPGVDQTHGGHITLGTPVTCRYIRLAAFSGLQQQNMNPGFAGFQPMYVPDVINATGTLISDTQTASSSRSSISGVIMYEDAAGVATLGTDLEIYFSADNGSNWTEASSYGTAITYTGNKKLVSLGKTDVTAGTQIIMKAVWANQSESKTTRLHGWAVNY